MEIINENYILLTFEFDENKKFNVNDFRRILLGNVKEIDTIKKKNKNLVIHNIPIEIDNLFIKIVKKKHDDDLNNEIEYLYPIDFSIIKRVVHSFKVGDQTRYTNKPAGILTLYKYLGPLNYIKDILKLLHQNLTNWSDNENDVFQNIKNLILILGSESKYLKKIVNQNYFFLHFEFCNEKADPNDFRRALLGLSRIYKGKKIPFKPNIPEIINDVYIKKIKSEYGENLDSDIRYLYPIDFSIIKRPISYDTESGQKKSDFAAGVCLLYKYMGPLTYINDFKGILEEKFKELKNSYFNKANEPLIIIGADLKYYKGF